MRFRFVVKQKHRKKRADAAAERRDSDKRLFGHSHNTSSGLFADMLIVSGNKKTRNIYTDQPYSEENDCKFYKKLCHISLKPSASYTCARICRQA